jgi:hypothetical protein
MTNRHHPVEHSRIHQDAYLKRQDKIGNYRHSSKELVSY